MRRESSGTHPDRQPPPIDHEMAPYVAYWRQRRAAEQTRDLRLAEQARADAESVARMLQQQYGVQRVILFGSLVQGRFGPESDIDLAVGGLPKQALFAAMAEANQSSRFWIDLKPLEELEPHFRRRVLQTGEDLLQR